MRSRLFKLSQNKNVREITMIYPCKPDIFEKTYDYVCDIADIRCGK